MSRHYVYWRVPVAEAARAEAAVRAVHARLGLQVELWRRPGAHDGLVTLMEVYDADAAAALEPAATQALAGLIDGTRHVERFERLA